MIGATFVKRYSSPDRAAAARAHWDWLTGLEAGVHLPALQSATTRELVFEHLGFRHPNADDLGALAQALGRLHIVAYRGQLHAARLNESFPTQHGLIINDFVTPRLTALERMPLPASGLPAALYKDANIRNFLLTNDGVAIVDFDDLTLAPFGYDLAKLVVSTAMTYGRLDPHEVELALEKYNAHTAQASPQTTCSMRQLRTYAEFHHLLTARYLGRNGYRHSWPDVRPWHESEISPRQRCRPLQHAPASTAFWPTSLPSGNPNTLYGAVQHHVPDGTGPQWASLADQARQECEQAGETGGLSWRHVLFEEVAEALAEADPAKLRRGLVQVAAVAVQWIQAIDHRSTSAAQEG